MKTLIVFSLFVLFHLGAWSAAHGWLSMNKNQTLVVVDTSYSMKPHFNDMEQWIENLRDGTRYTDVIIGTDKALIGPLGEIRSADSIFRSAFGKFSLDSLKKYGNAEADRKILLSDGSVDPGGWETVVFK